MLAVCGWAAANESPTDLEQTCGNVALNTFLYGLTHGDLSVNKYRIDVTSGIPCQRDYMLGQDQRGFVVSSSAGKELARVVCNKKGWKLRQSSGKRLRTRKFLQNLNAAMTFNFLFVVATEIDLTAKENIDFFLQVVYTVLGQYGVQEGDIANVSLNRDEATVELISEANAALLAEVMDNVLDDMEQMLNERSMSSTTSAPPSTSSVIREY